MTIKLYQLVALTVDFPQLGLKKGDTAYVVEHYSMPEDQEDGYSLEGFDIPIEGITVEVRESQIRPLSETELKEVEKNYSSVK